MLKPPVAATYEVTTPAKLNLFLEVAGKRADGYHELETLMVTISLYDTLRFTALDDSSIELIQEWCPANLLLPELPAGPQNLICKAASLLADVTGCTLGARIELRKRIPLAAGMAGGSSDAAATLIGLNRLWNLGLSLPELQTLGARLGSDVPFFLAGASTAVCRGRGELITPFKLPRPLYFVVVKPAAGLSTAQVFQNCQPAVVPETSYELVQSLQSGNLDRAGRCFMNRLGEPARRLCQPVTELSEIFSRLPVSGHLMSGSGTSYFGMCRNRLQANRLAGQLRALRLGQVFAVQSCLPPISV